MLRKDPTKGQWRGMLGASLPTFGATESMTKFAHTTPPLDAAARRKAPPVLTYSVEQLPSFDAAFYNGHGLSCPKLPSSRCRRGKPRHSRCRRGTSSAL